MTESETRHAVLFEPLPCKAAHYGNDSSELCSVALGFKNACDGCIGDGQRVDLSSGQRVEPQIRYTPNDGLERTTFVPLAAEHSSNEGSQTDD